MRPFWIIFLWSAILAGNLSAQETGPVNNTCWDHILPPLRNGNLLAYCPGFQDNDTICRNSVYHSEHPSDKFLVKNLNIQNLNRAYKYVCSKFGKMNENNFTCLAKMKTCLDPYIRNPPSQCVNGAIRCLYETMVTCSHEGAMIVSKALTMAKSTACTISSYQYKLKPFYGPEAHCYPELPESSGTSAAKLGPYYKRFCAGFQKENVSQCLENSLINQKSSLNLDEDYIEEAKKFFRGRSELCEYFSRPTHKTCPSVDVVSCQENLFRKDALQKPFDVLLESYAYCVYDKYITCDTLLAQTIKYNLDGIKTGISSVDISNATMLECADVPVNASVPLSMRFCTNYPDDLTKCLERSIYDSKNKFDQIFLKTLNIKNMNKAIKYLCAKSAIMTGDNFTCLMEMKHCMVPRGVHTLAWVTNLIPCLYQRTSKYCSPNVAVVIHKALTMAKSIGSKLSSYQYKLKPFYGPEVHCYPELPEPSGTSAAKLGPNYKRFCAEFQKEKMSQCVKNSLKNQTLSLNLGEDYIEEAKKFFRRRSELCEYFSRPTHKTCPSVDVVSCQENLFRKDAYKKPVDVLLKSYAECVYDKYITCDTTLAKTIKYNLDGIKSNATHVSVSFVFIISQVAIILSLFF